MPRFPERLHALLGLDGPLERGGVEATVAPGDVLEGVVDRVFEPDVVERDKAADLDADQ